MELLKVIPSNLCPAFSWAGTVPWWHTDHTAGLVLSQDLEILEMPVSLAVCQTRF